MSIHSSLCFTLCLLTLISQSYGTQLILANNCNESIWPGILAQEGQTAPRNGGFHLPCGEQVVIQATSNWSGRIWARRGCCFDSHGKGSCLTGDCNGQQECRGAAGQPPVTLVQMTLGTPQDPVHYYDVSLVDGFNLPISMTPVGLPTAGDCGVAACTVDLNVVCPVSLAVVHQEGGGVVVGCKSDCLATKAPESCCTGDYNDAQVCKPSMAAKVFKALCPRAYSFAFDRSGALHRCRSPAYVVTFCPAN